jgi:hypothetical protein
MEVKMVVLLPLCLSALTHAFFLYLLISLAESQSGSGGSEEKSFDNIVYYSGKEDIEDGIAMIKTETYPAVVPVILISKPRLPTPAPNP